MLRRGDMYCFLSQDWHEASAMRRVQTVSSSGLTSNPAVCVRCYERLRKEGQVEIHRGQERVYVQLPPGRPRRVAGSIRSGV